MMIVTDITVKVPKGITDIFKDDKDIQKEGMILIAIELYREGRISAGKAAEMAGLSFDEFIEELKRRKMKLYTLLKTNEIEEEVKRAETYLK